MVPSRQEMELLPGALTVPKEREAVHINAISRQWSIGGDGLPFVIANPYQHLRLHNRRYHLYSSLTSPNLNQMVFPY